MHIYFLLKKTNVDIIFSAHDTFLE